ncbi:MAG: type II toxin-antitoxin system RelE/ParE family toxin [Candidatus Omnitrophica bacterium]|nr:type II toxin-antitoxin system RelE/ParE family toxin [Candidatus Omnitrophota bacterium]
MIRSFACKETERLYCREVSRRVPPDIQRTALRKLWAIDAAIDLNTLRVPPANHLEAFSGSRKGQHSIRVNEQWRICFIWRDSHAYDVEIVDYH